jgi:O-antigen/teichoic acid export membrane protein
VKRNLTTAFASIAGSRLLMLVASAAITPALLYYLGSGPYGQYASVMAVFSMLMILLSSGVNGGVRKYIAEERDDENWKDHVFGYYFRLATLLGLLGAGLLVAGAATGVVSELMNADYDTYFYLLAVLVVAAQLRSIARRALMGLKLEHIAEPLQVVHKVLFGIVAVALAALGFGVPGVIVAFVAASTVVFAAAMALMARQVSLGAILRPVPDDFPRGELLNFNHLTVVYTFLLTSMYHVDVVLLDGIVGHEAAGLYKAALVLVQFLWFVPRSVQSVMIQSTSDLWAKGRTDRIEEIASRVTRYSLLITTLMAVGLGALAADFVPLYYHAENIDRMFAPILLLLPGTLGFAVSRPMLSINHAKGDLKTLIAATGIAAGLNLVLNLLLIPPYGMIGAAIATTIGYGSLPLVQTVAARRLGYDPLADARIGRIALATALAGLPIAALPHLINGSPIPLVGPSLLTAVVVPPVGFVLFSAVAVATGAVTVDEVFELLGSLPEPVSSRALALRSRVSGD